jgi:uncharacterized membrane protein YphA (DoxX/SURF4 family)
MSLERLSILWNNFWFEESSGLNLAVCRILFVGAFLLFMFPGMKVHQSLFEKYNQFQSPPVAVIIATYLVPQVILRTSSVFFIIDSLTILFGILTLIGLFTRISSFFFAVGSLFLISHIWSYGEFHHPPTLYLIFFLSLPFSTAGLRLSVDACLRRLKSKHDLTTVGSEERSMTVWPLKLMTIVMSIVYFNASWNKFTHAGLLWLNGYTLQSYLLQYGLQFDKPVSIWLGQQHLLCIIFSCFTFLFEGLFFTTLFWKKSVPYWLMAGILFHLGLCLLIEGSFAFFPWIVIYAAFVDFERVLSNKRDSMMKWLTAFNKSRVLKTPRPI